MGSSRLVDGMLAGGHLPSLTALRWVAASAVFVKHARLLGDTGYAGATGVSFFFMLSGFVLMWSVRSGQRPRDFLVRRIARVYPAYAVSAVVAVPILLAVGLFSIRTDLVPAAFTLTLLQSWVPDRSYYYGGNLVAWSLSNEAFFYLTFPALMVPVGRVVTGVTQRLWVVLAVLAAVSVSTPLLLQPPVEGGFRFWIIYITPVFRLIEFVIGMLLASALRHGRLPRVPLWPAFGLAIVGFVVAGQVPMYAMWSSVTLVPYMLVIVAVAQADRDERSPRLLRSPLAQRLGQWSYSFYLLHSVIVIAARATVNKLGLEPPNDLLMPLVYLVVVAASGLLHEMVEAPAERWVRQRFLSSERVPVGPATVS